MQYILPKTVDFIIQTLTKAGFEAHAVGGCVRDLIMNRIPTDWDITTSASPQRVKQLFPKCIDTGIRHGTVTIVLDGKNFEVSTWRSDDKYSDHRRPDQITFAASLEKDLGRRDFTMNAIAYHPEQGLIDPYLGQLDIHQKTIRCVGEPHKRLSEDALRMLRAVRFASQLSFSIHPQTMEGIKAHHKDLTYISFERIRCEIVKLLQSPNPQMIQLLWETGLASHIFPDLQTLPEPWLAIQEIVRETASQSLPAHINIALLFYTALPNDQKQIVIGHIERALRRLKFDTQSIRNAFSVIAHMDEVLPQTPRNLRKQIREWGFEAYCDIKKLKHLLGHTPHTFIPSQLTDYFPTGHTILGISGYDLIALGMNKGPRIKMILDLLNECVDEHPELNQKSTLLLLAKSILQKEADLYIR